MNVKLSHLATTIEQKNSLRWVKRPPVQMRSVSAASNTLHMVAAPQRLVGSYHI